MFLEKCSKNYLIIFKFNAIHPFFLRKKYRFWCQNLVKANFIINIIDFEKASYMVEFLVF